ncbi:GNAT family N-acetyltransferase [Phaeobacter sp. CAU 1743]|uniref:GNAT family N-acetyltransferase n=1 Tax=Phaeobacter sp. CAU 1743 TaxID=3140367 RepID=UPI0023B424C0
MTVTIPTIETERLILRAPDMSDFDVMCEFYASERATYVGGQMKPEQVWRHLACEIGHWHMLGYGRWMVDEKSTGKVAGNIGLWNPHGWPEPEIGWDLFEGFGGKGYATEAATAARSFAYDVLSWDTVISLVNPENHASRAVAKRLGARRDGDYTHPRLGTLELWRHLSPAEVTDGGMEAYA